MRAGERWYTTEVGVARAGIEDERVSRDGTTAGTRRDTVQLRGETGPVASQAAKDTCADDGAEWARMREGVGITMTDAAAMGGLSAAYRRAADDRGVTCTTRLLRGGVALAPPT